MYRNVTCPGCNKINQITNVNKYIGKKVRLICLNTACGREIILDLTEEDSDTTIVVHRNSNGNGKAELIQISDDNKNKVYPLIREESVVGRVSKNEPADIIIEHDPYVSRKHFCIKRQNNSQINGNGHNEYLIYGLNAKNTTKVNDFELKEGEKVYLKDGDVIIAGTTRLVFQLKS
jgi:pSer/pThr/pTyr-binding forkhead associated (FHA) protein